LQSRAGNEEIAYTEGCDGHIQMAQFRWESDVKLASVFNQAALSTNWLLSYRGLIS